MSVTEVLTSCNLPNELSVTLNTFFIGWFWKQLYSCKTSWKTSTCTTIIYWTLIANIGYLHFLFFNRKTTTTKISMQLTKQTFLRLLEKIQQYSTHPVTVFRLWKEEVLQLASCTWKQSCVRRRACSVLYREYNTGYR